VRDADRNTIDDRLCPAGNLEFGLLTLRTPSLMAGDQRGLTGEM
jgi:hypothetical protein